jgi:hypothetical protein
MLFKFLIRKVALDRVVLSVASAHRLRKKRCQEVADSSMTQFTEQVKEAEAPLVVHLDGEESLPVFTVILTF